MDVCVIADQYQAPAGSNPAEQLCDVVGFKRVLRCRDYRDFPVLQLWSNRRFERNAYGQEAPGFSNENGVVVHRVVTEPSGIQRPITSPPNTVE
jgi:hypothetical protein